MRSPNTATIANRLKASARAKLWAIAGTMGPVIISRFRELTLLFAGSLPDIALALVNSVILPLFSRKSSGGTDQSRRSAR